MVGLPIIPRVMLFWILAPGFHTIGNEGASMLRIRIGSRHISAHDDRRGVQWEIDIRNLREAVEGAR